MMYTRVCILPASSQISMRAHQTTRTGKVDYRIWVAVDGTRRDRFAQILCLPCLTRPAVDAGKYLKH